MFDQTAISEIFSCGSAAAPGAADAGPLGRDADATNQLPPNQPKFHFFSLQNLHQSSSLKIQFGSAPSPVHAEFRGALPNLKIVAYFSCGADKIDGALSAPLHAEFRGSAAKRKNRRLLLLWSGQNRFAILYMRWGAEQTCSPRFPSAPRIPARPPTSALPPLLCSFQPQSRGNLRAANPSRRNGLPRSRRRRRLLPPRPRLRSRLLRAPLGAPRGRQSHSQLRLRVRHLCTPHPLLPPHGRLRCRPPRRHLPGPRVHPLRASASAHSPNGRGRARRPRPGRLPPVRAAHRRDCRARARRRRGGCARPPVCRWRRRELRAPPRGAGAVRGRQGGRGDRGVRGARAGGPRRLPPSLLPERAVPRPGEGGGGRVHAPALPRGRLRLRRATRGSRSGGLAGRCGSR
ncbi:hypothetical protein C2845_PM12G23460 [Panicum miliaceum]|uniref:Uncharacterized protein n=1 Tax=Panicum miliaceum TaxID=4540 RepID=A0A3L6QFW2_PANMI|nr:hypothetical protein C2845_PM12G23460 [Panicum miliaceum]